MRMPYMPHANHPDSVNWQPNAFDAMRLATQVSLLDSLDGVSVFRYLGFLQSDSSKKSRDGLDDLIARWNPTMKRGSAILADLLTAHSANPHPTDGWLVLRSIDDPENLMKIRALVTGCALDGELQKRAKDWLKHWQQCYGRLPAPHLDTFVDAIEQVSRDIQTVDVPSDWVKKVIDGMCDRYGVTLTI